MPRFEHLLSYTVISVQSWQHQSGIFRDVSFDFSDWWEKKKKWLDQAISVTFISDTVHLSIWNELPLSADVMAQKTFSKQIDIYFSIWTEQALKRLYKDLYLKKVVFLLKRTFTNLTNVKSWLQKFK